MIISYENLTNIYKFPFSLLSFFPSMGKCLCKEAKIISISTIEEIQPNSLNELNEKLISLIFDLNNLLIQSRHQYKTTLTSCEKSNALISKVQEYQIEIMLKQVRAHVIELEKCSFKPSALNSLRSILKSIEHIEKQIESDFFNSLMTLNSKKEDFSLKIPQNFPLNSVLSDIDGRTEINQRQKGFKRRKYFKQ